MEEQSAFEAARLREKAAHCRKLAQEAFSNGTADELESIAREYENGAEKLELRRPPVMARLAPAGDETGGMKRRGAHAARIIRNTATKHLVGAAEKGDAIAQFNLGVFLDNCVDDNGHATAGDRTAAIEWLSRAAGQDLSCAQIKLAEIYAERADSPKHCVASCAWFLRAIPGANGAHRQRAMSGFERMSKQLTPEQVATARHLASAGARGAAEQSFALEAYLE